MVRSARRRRLAALAVGALMASCAAGPAGPADRAPPTARRASAAARGAPVAPDAAPAVPDIAPTSVLDRRPQVVELRPAVVPARLAVRRVDTRGARGLIAVDATGPRDVWTLTEDGRLLRSTGAGLVAERPPCPLHPAFSPSDLRVSASAIVLAGHATHETPGLPITRRSFGTARRGGPWQCRDHPSFEWHEAPIGVALLPGAAWAAHPAEDGGLATWSTDGVPFALPSREMLGRRLVWRMLDRRRGWLFADGCEAEQACTGRAWESRGAGWMPRPDLADLGAADVWIDDAMTPWVAGAYLAFFRGDRWHRVALPDGFVARRVAGSGPDDVWLTDTQRLVHFDGARLAEAPAPFRVVDIVFVPGSGLWVVGGPEPASDGEGGALPTRGEAAVVTVASRHP